MRPVIENAVLRRLAQEGWFQLGVTDGDAPFLHPGHMLAGVHRVARLVPAIRVDGRTLVESNAILAHIADRRPEARLLPPNGSWERDLANEWLAYLASGFHAAFWPYFRPDRYTTDAAHEASVKGAAERAVRRELTTLNRHLDGREWVLESGRSVLDAYVHAMDRWANPFVQMPNEFPHVWRHQKTLASDRAVRFALAAERSVDADRAASSCVGHAALAEMLSSSR